ncbi:hypothetical protein RO1_15480 [Roseburia intestinalis XB6B4]|uniref:Uncharacterized protein n=1 Tax=Roseburia intestinalis XB6B4 TaxID=718255 RepID=D4KXR1_9FIRM|nr:hypothetical protein RO1_15480 [Roseburia intestinalis XB6B4]
MKNKFLKLKKEVDSCE